MNPTVAAGDRTESPNASEPWWLARGGLIHERAVTSLLFSPDGHVLFAGDASGELRWWSTETSELLFFDAGATPVTALDLDADSERLAVAGLGAGNAVVSVYLVRRKKRAFVLRGYDVAIDAVAFSPDGKSLATIAQDSRLSVWNLAKKTCAFEVELPRPADPCAWGMAVGPILRRTVCWTPDGKTLVVTGSDGRVWRVSVDADATEVITELGRLHALGVAPNGAGSVFCTVNGRVGRVESDGSVSFLAEGGTGAAVAINGSRQGTAIAATRGDETLVVYGGGAPAATIVNGTPTSEERRAGAVAVEDAAVAWSASSAIRIWKNDLREELAHITGHRGAVTSVDWLGDERLLSAGEDQRLLLWHVPDRAIEAELRMDGARLSACSVSADGTRVCVADVGGVIHIVDARNLAPGRQWKANILSVTGLAFSPDGGHVASAGGGGHARIWDVATATMIADLHDAIRLTTFVAWCPMGRRVLFGTDWAYANTNASITSVSVDGWRVEWKKHLPWLHGAVFDHTGNVFVAKSDGEVCALAPDSGEELRTFGTRVPRKRRSHRLQGTRSVSISSGGLAWADDEFRVQLSDSARTTVEVTLEPNDMRCRALALHPDGTRLAIGGTRGQLGVWTRDRST